MASGPTIMIVDDSMTARAWTVVALREIFEGADLIEIEDGQRAIAAAAESDEFDGVLVDINMPGIDGFQVAQAIQQARPGLPMAILSANVQRKARERAVELGLEFIDKPISQQKLRGFVEAVEKRRA